uniref:Uncharacterized protein n=1 Tax=Steinernema glaseri TaxID=37863 RepID=A0A1I7YJ12_9BILA
MGMFDNARESGTLLITCACAEVYPDRGNLSRSSPWKPPPESSWSWSAISTTSVFKVLPPHYDASQTKDYSRRRDK